MKVNIYRTQEKGVNLYHWNLKSRNGKIVATAGEKYKKLSNCYKMVMKIFNDRFSVVMKDC